jgi:cell shape-determining protein MreD
MNETQLTHLAPIAVFLASCVLFAGVKWARFTNIAMALILFLAVAILIAGVAPHFGHTLDNSKPDESWIYSVIAIINLNTVLLMVVKLRSRLA